MTRICVSDQGSFLSSHFFLSLPINQQAEPGLQEVQDFSQKSRDQGGLEKGVYIYLLFLGKFTLSMSKNKLVFSCQPYKKCLPSTLELFRMKAKVARVCERLENNSCPCVFVEGFS